MLPTVEQLDREIIMAESMYPESRLIDLLCLLRALLPVWDAAQEEESGHRGYYEADDDGALNFVRSPCADKTCLAVRAARKVIAQLEAK